MFALLRDDSNGDLEYEYMTVHTLPLPSPYMLASCAQLDSQIARLKDEQKRILQASNAVGKEIRSKFEQNRDGLRLSIAQTAAALASKKVDSIAANVGAGLAAVLTAVGAVVDAPVAVGSIAALEIISGPSIFGWQVIKRKQADNADIMLGYARDRAFMFSSLAAEKATSTPGRIVGKSLSIVSLLSSFSDALEAHEDKEQLLAQGKSLSDELALLDRFMQRLGTNDAAWANCYRNVVDSAVQHLTSFVQATRNQGCTIQGPIIIKPLK